MKGPVAQTFRRWLDDYLQHNVRIVQEIHVPATDLSCEACSQPWPCHPFSSAAGSARADPPSAVAAQPHTA